MRGARPRGLASQLTGERCCSRLSEVHTETQRGLVDCQRAHSFAHCRADNPISLLPIPQKPPDPKLSPFIGPGLPVQVGQQLQTRAHSQTQPAACY